MLINNINPFIDPVQNNGKQQICVHDYQSGNMRYIITSPKEIDTFINTRRKKLCKAQSTADNLQYGLGLLGLVLGMKLIDRPGLVDAFASMSTGILLGTALGEAHMHNTDMQVTQAFIDNNK